MSLLLNSRLVFSFSSNSWIWLSCGYRAVREVPGLERVALLEVFLLLAALVHLVLDEAYRLLVLLFLLLLLASLDLQLAQVLLARRDVHQMLFQLPLADGQVRVQVVVVLGHLGVLAEAVSYFFEELVAVFVALDGGFFFPARVEGVHLFLALLLDVFGLGHAWVPSS